MNDVLKPQFRLMGGKRAVAGLIADKLLEAAGGPWGSYTEGFVGAGAVLLHTLSQRSRYYCNYVPEILLFDLDRGTALFWQRVFGLKGPQGYSADAHGNVTLDACRQTFAAVKADLVSRDLSPRDAFFFIREKYNACCDSVNSQNPMSLSDTFFAYWWILRQTIFNGIWRVNSKGYCNSTWSKRDPHLVSFVSDEFVRALPRAWVYLGRCDLRTCFLPDALVDSIDRALIATVAGPHVAYFDPPYYGGEDKYASESWSVHHHRNLIRDCAKLAKRGVIVGYANHARPEVLSWVTEIAVEEGVSVSYTEILSRRSVSAKAKGRNPVPEGFWILRSSS